MKRSEAFKIVTDNLARLKIKSTIILPNEGSDLYPRIRTDELRVTFFFDECVNVFAPTAKGRSWVEAIDWLPLGSLE